MDAIGLKQPIAIPTPTLPAPRADAAVVSGASGSANAVTIGGNADGFDAQAAEAKRVDAVRRAAQNIANTYVVSDTTFSLFKDATGQYITRFTSLRDGKVTYIPEPSLFKLGGSSGNDVEPLLQIKV